MQDRAERAAVYGLFALFKHMRENTLTKSDKTLQKKLLAFYQTFNLKDKNLEQIRQDLTELYVLCQHNQDQITVAESEKTAPGLGFALLITQLPANVNMWQLVFPNLKVKNTMELSPCAEPE